jgi:hypothetical protein
MKLRNRVVLGLSVAVAAQAGPFWSMAQAQQQPDAGGFDFGEDEVEQIGEPMDFGDEEVPPVEAPPTTPASPATRPPIPDDGITTVTAIIVPGAVIDASVAARYTDAVIARLAAIPDVTVVPNDALEREFAVMGPELAFECAFDPICLGRYGRQLGLDRIVVGRVDAGAEGRWGTTLDLFEIGASAISQYRYFESAPGLDAVENALEGEVKALFGIRDARGSGPGLVAEPSKWQRIGAWSALGVSAASLGLSAVYGIQSASTQSDLEDCRRIDLSDGSVVCDITQKSAQTLIDEGDNQALMSRLFLGSGVFFGAVSALLFTLSPGQDAEEVEDEDIARRDFNLAPVVSSDSFGFTGTWRF